MMKIWHISDTHTYHGLLKVPEDIDMVIHSGDATNPRDPYASEQEMLNFISWFGSLPIKYKVFVAGNHDLCIERNLITKIDFMKNGIVYLENDYTEVEGIKIWGSPFTPTFGEGWAFNKKRSALHDVWKHIPDDVDIVVVHGPPKGILDLAYHQLNCIEFCGDEALRKRMYLLNPKLCLFGHIHNNEDIINAGTMKLSNHDTIYSNGSVVTDGKFGKLSSHGNTFEI
jgi:Icc-related predicted phosphoesterase